MTTTASSGDITVADDPSFEAFFSVEFTRLAQALFLLTGSSSEAEELAQEAMVRVCERWGRVSVLDSLAGYLFRTALNPASERASWRVARAYSHAGTRSPGP
jgi:DNA-directed RNA polymerase specialized sigma24 family protein